MGRVILAKDFIDYTVLSATSESGNRLKENIAKIFEPFLVWRSTGTAQQRIVVDMLQARSQLYAFVNNVNFPNLTFEFNGTNEWTSPAVSQAHTVGRDVRVDRRKGFFSFSLANLRYASYFVPSQTPDNGETDFKIGAVALFTEVVELEENPEMPLAINIKDPLKFIKEEDSQITVDTLIVGPKYLQLEIGFEAVSVDPDDSFRLKIFDFIENTRGKPFFFYFNRGHSEEAYIVRKVGEIREEWDKFPFETSMRGFILEEAVF